mgnify:CR=1 FL=1
MTVTLALAKQHLRVDSSEEDDLIAQYMAAALVWVEQQTGKKMAVGAVTQIAVQFGNYIPLLWGPFVSLTSIAYTDTDDAPQTVTAARVRDGRIYAPEAGWPGIADYTPIVVTYQAGYSTVPAPLDSAQLLLIGEYYDNREAGVASSAVSAAVESLCRPYRDCLV